MGPQRSHSYLDHLGAVGISATRFISIALGVLANALSFYSSVGRLLHRNFRALAESREEKFNSAGYEFVNMDVYVPILDLPQRPNNASRALSNVAIQGNVNFDRRDYLGVYADLLASLNGEHCDVFNYNGEGGHYL
jgi:hypothetical protein